MGWSTRDGTIHTKLTPQQSCSECGTKLAVQMKCDPRDADTWMWHQCFTCGEPFCYDCADDAEGEVECITCAQSRMWVPSPTTTTGG